MRGKRGNKGHKAYFTQQLDIFSMREKIGKKKRHSIKKKIPKYLRHIVSQSNTYKYYVISFFTLILLYIFLYSEVFSVKEIYIYRNDSLSNIDVAYRSIDYIRGQKIYSVDSKSIVTRLQNSQKSLKFITIKKKLPSTLEILLDSYQAIFSYGGRLILENGSTLPKNGKVVNEVAELSIYPPISDNDILDFQHLELIQNIVSGLKKNILGVEINSISYYRIEEEVLIEINNGLILIFDLEKEILTQIEKLSIFSNEKENILGDFAVYIDLRIDAKVFTCSNEEQGNCKNNIESIYPNWKF